MVSIKACLYLFVIMVVICQFSQLTNAYSIYRQQSDNDFIDEINGEILDFLKAQEQESNKRAVHSEIPIVKRSDIDARLLEVRAKILLNKAYSRLPHGHGKFNFHLIGKRSTE